MSESKTARGFYSLADSRITLPEELSKQLPLTTNSHNP